MKNRHITLLCCSLILIIAACSETKSTIELKADASSSLQSGNISTAIILIKNIIKSNPNDAEARFLLGKAYLQNDEFLSAEKELNKARELNFISPELNILTAKILLAQNKFDEIIETIEPSSFSSDHNKILAHIMMSKAYLSLDNIKEAKKHIDKSNEIDSQSPHSILGLALISAYQSNTTQALKLIENVINISPLLPEALLLKGSIESKMEAFELAANTYAHYVELKPNSFNIQTLVAHNFIRAGKYQQAQEVIDSLLIVTEQHPTVNLLAAQLALVDNKYDVAKEFANKVLISTNNGLAQIISGLSDYYLGNNEQAFYQLNAIADDLPKSHKIHQVLAVLQLKLGYTDELNQTLANLNEQNIESASFFANIGNGLAQQGDFQGANQLFERAVKMSPKNAEIKTQQGILKLINTDASGITDLQDALALEPKLAEANIALAMTYLKQGEIKKATEIADEWLAKEPSNANALLLRGNIAIKTVELNAAKSYFNQAMKVAPDNTTPIFNLAVIEAEQRNFTISTELLDKLLNINKEYPAAYRLLISNAMELKEEDALKDKLLKTIKSSPDSVWPRIILSRKLNIDKKYQEANNILEALNNYESLPVVYFITLSNNYLIQQKFDDVELLFSKWQKAQPNNSRAYIMHLNFLEKQNKHSKALEVTQRALNHAHLRKDFQLLSFESYFLLLTKQLEQATIKAQRLSQIKPEDPFVLRIQGQINLAKKDYNLAIQQLNKSLKQKKDFYTVLYLATAYKNNNEIKTAIQFLETELKESPKNDAYRKFLANLYIHESPNDAIEHYKQVVSANPKDIVALNNLAWLLYKNNNLEPALKYATQAQTLAPEHPQILDTLGIILTAQNKLNKAIEALKTANKISPKSAEIIIHLAQAYKANKNETQAKSLIAQLSDEEKKKWVNDLKGL